MSDGARWALAGGGTGGHIVPGLHLLQGLAARGVELEHLLWFTSGRAVEERVLAGLEARAPAVHVQRAALPLEPEGGGAPGLGLLARRLLPATLRARRELVRARTELVLGLGGFTAAPAVLAARSLGLPAYLLEVNAVAGRATRVLAPLCRRVFHAFEASRGAREAAGSRHMVVGPVVGPAFEQPAADAGRRLREQYGLPVEFPLLAVLGGSQGAAGLNAFLRDHSARLLEGCSVVHQVGPGRMDEAAAAHGRYRPLEYVEDVPLLLAGADLTLCRGGASTLAEVAALGARVLVVPYPHHPDQHQARNARELGFPVLEEAQLGSGTVDELLGLLQSAADGGGPAGAPALGGAGRVLDELLGGGTTYSS